MKAVVGQGKGLGSVVLSESPIPQPGPHEVRLKVITAAFNPVDQAIVSYGIFVQSYPVALGCDAAGVVDAVGEHVNNLKPGDRVFCYPGLGIPNHGGFAEYLINKHHLFGLIPENMSFEEASTVAVGALTAGDGLYTCLGLPLISSANKDSLEKLKGENILIWGGSGSVGSFAVQLAALMGLNVIATCSPRNFDLVKAYGAKHVVDYNSPDAIQQIRDIAGNKLYLAFDTIGGEATKLSIQACNNTDASKPVKVSATAPYKGELPQNVTFKSTALGAAYGNHEAEHILRGMLEMITELLASGKLKPSEYELLPNGLNSVVEGLTRLAEKKVSGKKLVIRVAN